MQLRKEARDHTLTEVNAIALLRVLAPERERFVHLARRRLQSGADAEDTVQRALARAALRAGSLEDPARARPWFYRILRRAIIDHQRARSHDPLRAAGAVDVAGIAGAEGNPAPAATCACSLRLLAAIRPAYAEALRRVELNGEDPAAVAVALGISPGNLHVRLHRARRALREQVKHHCGVASHVPCLDCTCDDHRRCSSLVAGA